MQHAYIEPDTDKPDTGMSYTVGKIHSQKQSAHWAVDVTAQNTLLIRMDHYF